MPVTLSGRSRDDSRPKGALPCPLGHRSCRVSLRWHEHSGVVVGGRTRWILVIGLRYRYLCGAVGLACDWWKRGWYG
jgi:hypothetical protein